MVGSSEVCGVDTVLVKVSADVCAGKIALYPCGYLFGLLVFDLNSPFIELQSYMLFDLIRQVSRSGLKNLLVFASPCTVLYTEFCNPNVAQDHRYLRVCISFTQTFTDPRDYGFKT